MDITSKNSFDLIQKLINNIEIDKFPSLKRIFIQNKKDLGSQREINSNEIEEFLRKNITIENEDISLKTGENFNNLLNKCYSAINDTQKKFPCDYILESTDINTSFINYAGSLSFILIGDSTVGKSCFFKRYFRNEFSEGIFHTIGIDKETKHIKIGDNSYKITLWDTAGQEKFRFLPKKYYNNADGIFLLFDVTNEESFNNVSSWMNDVKDNSGKTTENEKKSITLFLIGNKIDLPEREVSKEQAEMQAKSLGVKYFEISCKINMNIPEVMQSMIMECYKKVNNNEISSFKLKKTKTKKLNKKGSCC